MWSVFADGDCTMNANTLNWRPSYFLFFRRNTESIDIALKSTLNNKHPFETEKTFFFQHSRAFVPIQLSAFVLQLLTSIEPLNANPRSNSNAIL